MYPVRSSRQKFLMKKKKKNKTHREDSLLTSFIVWRCKIVASTPEHIAYAIPHTRKIANMKQAAYRAAKRATVELYYSKPKTIECVVCFCFAFI